MQSTGSAYVQITNKLNSALASLSLFGKVYLTKQPRNLHVSQSSQRRERNFLVEFKLWLGRSVLPCLRHLILC